MDGVEYRMRWVPPGRFMMGSPETEEGRWDDEGPQHEVELTTGLWLGETPVTQALWVAVMGDNPSHFEGRDRPVEQVSWDDCIRFCDTLEVLAPGLGVRLPSEAEWEYACRAGSTGPTYGARDDIAWWDGNSDGATHPVRRKQPNAWGLYDMLGNVWEWCSDAWQGYRDPVRVMSRAAAGAAADVLQDPVVVGSEGDARVHRGGSWDFLARFVRAAIRDAYQPGYRSGDLGFRLARGQE